MGASSFAFSLVDVPRQSRARRFVSTLSPLTKAVVEDGVAVTATGNVTSWVSCFSVLDTVLRRWRRQSASI